MQPARIIPGYSEYSSRFSSPHHCVKHIPVIKNMREGELSHIPLGECRYDSRRPRQIDRRAEMLTTCDACQSTGTADRLLVIEQLKQLPCRDYPLLIW